MKKKGILIIVLVILAIILFVNVSYADTFIDSLKTYLNTTITVGIKYLSGPTRPTLVGTLTDVQEDYIKISISGKDKKDAIIKIDDIAFFEASPKE